MTSRQKTLIFGLGQEGISTRKYLEAQDQSYVITDDTQLEESAYISLPQATAALAAGEISQVIKSPGIPWSHSLLQAAQTAGTPISSNLELFWSELRTLKDAYPDQQIMTIGVTGTKGKSTTTAFIHHYLQTAGQQVFLGGNIGTPFLDLLPLIRASLNPPDSQANSLQLVFELSSHQLSRVSNLQLDIAVLLPLSPEHLDYYSSAAEYYQAKANITLSQNSDQLLIYAAQNQPAAQIAAKSKAHLIPIPTQELTQIKQLPSKLLGDHQLYNTLPAKLIGHQLNMPAQIYAQALATFTPLPHRLELVAQSHSVSGTPILFVNDSLATTPEATIAALKSFADSNVYLLVGGYQRGLDYAQLSQFLASAPQLSQVVALPDTGHALATQLEATKAVQVVETLEEGVKAAYHAALKSPSSTPHVILLSPAAASFNQFDNYAQRGAAFTQTAQALIAKYA